MIYSCASKGNYDQQMRQKYNELRLINIKTPLDDSSKFFKLEWVSIKPMNHFSLQTITFFRSWQVSHFFYIGLITGSREARKVKTRLFIIISCIHSSSLEIKAYEKIFSAIILLSAWTMNVCTFITFFIKRNFKNFGFRRRMKNCTIFGNG